MKEAFWGILIVILGMLGIVIIQVFQSVTITNDQTHYLLKEVTEASMHESIDLAHYRTTGKIKIVKEKFAENFTRRFAESANIMSSYNIKIHEIIEEPPKVSISIGSNIISLSNDNFRIGDSLNAIVETKYTKEEVEDKTETPIPPEPTTPDSQSCPTCDVNTDPNCKKTMECIPGDLRFKSWENKPLNDEICPENPVNAITKAANYEYCNCGVWEERKENITSTVGKTTNYFSHTWKFTKSTDVRSLNITDVKKQYFAKCTTDIKITDPSDPDYNRNNVTNPVCPASGVNLYVGEQYTIKANYIPPDAVNRNLKWTRSNNNISMQSSNPNNKTGHSVAVVTGITPGETTITVETTNQKTDTCKINVKKWECPTTILEMETESTAQIKIDGVIPNGATYSIENAEEVATVSSTGLITSKNRATTITYNVSKNNLNLTCNLKVNAKPIPPDTPVPNPTPGGTGVCRPGSISVHWDSTNRYLYGLPDMCPQELEENRIPVTGVNATYIPAETKLGNINVDVAYCGRWGGYIYPSNYRWDYFEPRYAVKMYNNSKLTINETNRTYSITHSRSFNYDYNFWNSAVAPYLGNNYYISTRTFTGKLLNRTDTKCRNYTPTIPTPYLEITNNPNGLLIGNTYILVADYGPATIIKPNTFVWTSDNTSVIEVTNRATGAIKAKANGIAKLKVTVGTYGDPSYLTEEVTIAVVPSCANSSISYSPSDNPLIVKNHYDFTFNTDSPANNAMWSASNSNVEINSQNKLASRKGVVPQKSFGKTTITATRVGDNCTKTITVDIAKKMVCPRVKSNITGNWIRTTSYDDNYCYTTANKIPFKYECRWSNYQVLRQKNEEARCYKTLAAFSANSSDYKTATKICNGISLNGVCYIKYAKVPE